jgi:hypothetical protein
MVGSPLDGVSAHNCYREWKLTVRGMTGNLTKGFMGLLDDGVRPMVLGSERQR